MEFLNGVGLSTTLRDGEGIVIPHNKLRSAPIHLVRVRELHGIEKGNPFPEADVGAGIRRRTRILRPMHRLNTTALMDPPREEGNDATLEEGK
jgi:hypothetical protein